MKAGATATPHASLLTFTWRASKVRGRKPRERVVKRPLGPRAGAVNVTSTPATGSFFASLTVTARGSGKRLPGAIDWLAPTPTVSLPGLPATLETAPHALEALPSAFVSENNTEPYAELAMTV